MLLLTWNTATDEFEYGQWLKGRIYERRCDLSPNGELLLYFAAKQRPPLFTWSAVSRPPYLTALALWPKGDAWGGGGVLESDREIHLNHGPHQMGLAEGFHVPKWMEVRAFGRASGWGEDDPVWAKRLERDGWTRVSRDPVIWEKPHPVARDAYTLQMAILGMHETNGPWYVIEHEVTSRGNVTHRLGRSDWAEWSPDGDLLFAKGGSLYRLDYRHPVLPPVAEARELIDLKGAAFAEREAPAWAQQWPKPARSRRRRS